MNRRHFLTRSAALIAITVANREAAEWMKTQE